MSPIRPFAALHRAVLAAGPLARKAITNPSIAITAGRVFSSVPKVAAEPADLSRKKVEIIRVVGGEIVGKDWSEKRVKVLSDEKGVSSSLASILQPQPTGVVQQTSLSSDLEIQRDKERKIQLIDDKIPLLNALLDEPLISVIHTRALELQKTEKEKAGKAGKEEKVEPKTIEECTQDVKLDLYKDIMNLKSALRLAVHTQDNRETIKKIGEVIGKWGSSKFLETLLHQQFSLAASVIDKIFDGTYTRPEQVKINYWKALGTHSLDVAKITAASMPSNKWMLYGVALVIIGIISKTELGDNIVRDVLRIKDEIISAPEVSMARDKDRADNFIAYNEHLEAENKSFRVEIEHYTALLNALEAPKNTEENVHMQYVYIVGTVLSSLRVELSKDEAIEQENIVAACQEAIGLVSKNCMEFVEAKKNFTTLWDLTPEAEKNKKLTEAAIANLKARGETYQQKTYLYNESQNLTNEKAKIRDRIKEITTAEIKQPQELDENSEAGVAFLLKVSEEDRAVQQEKFEKRQFVPPVIKPLGRLHEPPEIQKIRANLDIFSRQRVDDPGYFRARKNLRLSLEAAANLIGDQTSKNAEFRTKRDALVSAIHAKDFEFKKAALKTVYVRLEADTNQVLPEIAKRGLQRQFDTLVQTFKKQIADDPNHPMRRAFGLHHQTEEDDKLKPPEKAEFLNVMSRHLAAKKIQQKLQFIEFKRSIAVEDIHKRASAIKQSTEVMSSLKEILKLT